MPARPRYGKKRRPQQPRAPVAQRSASGPQPVATPAVTTASKPQPHPKTPPLPARTYPFIGGEIKVIGILIAAIMVILIVLARVLR